MAVIVREKVKGSGEWWVFINHKNKRRSKKIGSKKAANNVKREVEAKLANGDLGLLKDEVPTVTELGKKYIDDPTREWATNTRTSYAHLFKNHIKPHEIGQMPLDQVAMHHVKDFLGDLNRKKLAKGTIQFIRMVLHGIFEEARVYEYVTVNPCTRTGKFVTGNGKEKQKEKVKPYTAEQAAEVIEQAKAFGLRFHALIALLARTGVRIGEALGLSWGDINLEERTADVKKSWSYYNQELGSIKTGKPREIDLTHYTVEVLKQLREQSSFSRDTDPVFCSSKGKRISDEVVRRQYYKIRLRDDVTVHDLRHTYATLRLAKGDNLIDVSRQLGHKNPSITLDVYAGWLPRYHKGQVDELDTLHLSAPYTHPEQTESTQVADIKKQLH